MAFKRPLPEWNNPGVEPPQSKKDMGWLGREKPPAQWHNWFQHLTYEALKELQENAAHVTFGETAPASPDENDLWIDTSGFPVLVLKAWDGTQWIIVGAVNSVNGKTGDVELTAEDVGAASLTDFNEHLTDFAKFQFGDRPYTSTVEKIYYIDAVNGNDENDGESPETAFKTWAKAKTMIPRYRTHSIAITIIGNLDEEITIEGTFGSHTAVLTLQGETTTPSSHVISKNINIYNSSGITIRYIKTTGLVRVTNSMGIRITNSELHNSTDSVRYGAYFFSSKGDVMNCDFGILIAEHCIVAQTSQVLSSNNTGQGSISGLFSTHGSLIGKAGTQPTGLVADEYTQQGGVIFSNNSAFVHETGTNANGTYVRWCNGLQICWAGRSVINWPAQPTANVGSTYYSSEFTWTFPASFIDTNIVITANPGYVGTDGSWGITTIYNGSITTTSVLLSLWTTHSRPNPSNGTAMAIGRWK